MGNLCTTDSFIYRSTVSGVLVYDTVDNMQVALIPYMEDVTSVWVDDSYVYMGTTNSGVCRCLVTTVTGTQDVLPYKNSSDITNNHVNYLHGNSNYLCVTTLSGVDQYNLLSGDRVYTDTQGATKCYQTTNGCFYYVTNPFISIEGLDYSVHDWTYNNLITLSGTISVEGYQYLFELPTSIYNSTQIYGEDIRFIQDNGMVAPHYIETWKSPKEITVVSMPAKSVVIDCMTNYGGIDVGIRSVDFYLNGNKITIIEEDITCYASSYESSAGTAAGIPYQTFVTGLSKVGSSHNLGWQSNSWSYAAERLICVFDDPINFDEIRINNFHSAGGDTGEGAKDVKIHISTDAITNTTYNSTVPNSSLIFYGIFDKHVGLDIEYEQILPLDFTPIYNDGTVSPKVWVKCSEGVDSLYMLYGNDAVSSTSSPEDVFDLYEDFSVDELDTTKWVFDDGGYSGNTYQISDGKFTFDNNSNSWRLYLKSVDSYSYGIMESRLRYIARTNTSDLDFYSGWLAGTYADLNLSNEVNDHRLINTSQSNIIGTHNMTNTFTAHTLVADQNHQSSEYDGETLVLTDSIPSTAHQIVFSYCNDSSQPDIQIDWVRIRKHILFPPSYIIGETRLVEDVFDVAKLHAVYDNSNDWVTDLVSTEVGYTYNNISEALFDVSYINDIYVTEDTSINGGNIIFLATSYGAIVIEEKRGDEINCRQRIYLLKT